jgi:hypothetical protein
LSSTNNSYSDWVLLNHPDLVEGRRHTLDLSRYLEAVGDLMELQLTASHDPATASAAYSVIEGTTVDLGGLDSAIPTSPLLPPVYFHGRSQQQAVGAGAPASFVRGVARLTADNPPEVRWTMIIRYSGEDRWKLEGVQVGGRQSRRGFFGVSETGAERRGGLGWTWSLSQSQARTECRQYVYTLFLFISLCVCPFFF